MATGKELVSASNIKTILRDGSVLKALRRRMGLGDTLGVLPPECGGTGSTSGFDINKVYPVGSIYMNINATNPKILFGRTWQQIQGRFLLAASSTYKAGSTGGEAEHELTVDEMPSHTHGLRNGNRYNFGEYQSFSQQRTSTRYEVFRNLIEPTGSGKAHNNMPPYLAVYIWKRTA